MARLKNPPRRLASLPARTRSLDATKAERSRTRDASQAWRAWYKTARWQRLRWSILVRDGFTCTMCGGIEADTSQLVCDHIERHGGDEGKFWAGPFQTLCKPCHDGTKQRVENQRAGRSGASHPAWLQPSAVELVIVCGPPASGKSRYISERARPEDCVIDLDLIVAGLAGSPIRHDWDRNVWLEDALWRRNALLGALSRRRTGRAWFSIMEPSASWRGWWREKLRPAEIVILETGVETCLRQAAEDPDRDPAATRLAVAQWWADYEPASEDRRLPVR